MQLKKSTLFVALVASVGVGIGLGNLNDIISYFTPIPNITDAHQYSVNYRNDAGICDGSEVKVETFFELTYDQANDLKNAMRNIRGQHSPNPESFRLIFGLENPGDVSGKLLVVGIDENGLEDRFLDGIKAIDGYLPCPRFCDFTKSEVIKGTNAHNECGVQVSGDLDTALPDEDS